MQAPTSHYAYGFVRVAGVVPKLRIGDITFNTREIIKSAQEAAKQGASFIVFPELSLTGYTIGDLFHQELVWKGALQALETLKKELRNNPALILVGSPLLIDGVQLNVAIALYKGKVVAVIPKTYLPGYKEFYEERWFSGARDISVESIEICGDTVPVGPNILIKSQDGKVVFAVEICEDLWGPLPPSSFHAVAGANIIANLSASNELVGKADYRRELVRNQSAHTISSYIYVSCGVHESTTDLAFSGHAIIAENGNIAKETELFEPKTQIILADVDINHSKLDRIRTTSFADSARELAGRTYRTVVLSGFAPKGYGRLLREIVQNPFIPAGDAKKDSVSNSIFSIQVAGLYTRLLHTGINKAVIGLSGGLDSTLALLVVIHTFKKLGLPLGNIHALTMPGFGTTTKTKNNAYLLAKISGITLEEIDISAGAEQQFRDIGHDGNTEDVTFENVQARYRTMILMNRANQIGGMVIGTGDLSEIALGWATFNGDHISHYNVNVGVPKTLVRSLVSWISRTFEDKKMSETLQSILDTPVSPELKRHQKGKITHRTEDIIGPYELHDFFLYHFVRWGTEPKKIVFLAETAYKGKYNKVEIKKWLTVFIKRFFGNQWKRSVASDGPKVGSVSLSPRGDWRMPSDASMRLWLDSLR